MQGELKQCGRGSRHAAHSSCTRPGAHASCARAPAPPYAAHSGPLPHPASLAQATKRARRAANKAGTVAVGALEPPSRNKKKLRMMAKRARFVAQPIPAAAPVKAEELAAMVVEQAAAGGGKGFKLKK